MKREQGGRIVVCGHLCLDVIPTFPPAGSGQDWFRPGRLSLVDAPVISTGGAVSNVGISLHRLGFSVRLVAKIGSDPLGKLLIERVHGMGEDLALGIMPVDREVTSYTVVLNPPGVDRIFLHCPGANDTFTAEDVDDAALDGASIFHFGYPPLMKQLWSDGGEGLGRLMRRAREHGALTSLDMSLPDPASPSGRIDWASFLDRVLPFVDLFVPSVEELFFMADRAGFERLSKQGGGDAIVHEATFADLARLSDVALRLGVAVVLIKIGDRGAYLRTGPRSISSGRQWANRELYSPCFAVPAVAGTTGAGDATIAGLLGSLVHGLPPEEALTMAVAVGASCVEAQDATSGVRPWAETLSRIHGGWKRVATRIDEAGWRPMGDIWQGPADVGT